MPKIRYSSSGRKTKAHGNLFFKKAALSLPTISGGVISTDSVYRYHTFRSTAQLEVVGGTLNNAEILLIAGGGNQANGYTSGYSNPTGGAGGGAGGLINSSNISLAPGTYTAIVGAGGSNNSDFVTETNVTVSGTAIGGGYGGQWYFYAPSDGGSGGGGDWNAPGGLGTPGQGNNGGAGFRYYGTVTGGSGGGAGTPGGNWNSGGGGQGFGLFDWAAATQTGDQGYYAGGGGGSGNPYPGLGGGNFPNTGSGGTTNVHGPGSGLFILRYPKSNGNA